MKIRTSALESIESISNIVENESISPLYVFNHEDLESAINNLKDVLLLSRIEAVLFSGIFILNSSDNYSQGIIPLSEILNISRYEALKQFSVVLNLEKRGLVHIETERSGDYIFKVDRTFFSAIIMNEREVYGVQKKRELNFFDYMQKTYDLLNHHYSEHHDFVQLKSKLVELKKEYLNLVEVKWLESWKLEIEEHATLVFLAYKHIQEDGGSFSVHDVIKKLHYSIEEIYRFKNNLMNGRNVLTKKKLVEYREPMFLGGNSFGLTEKSTSALLNEMTIFNRKKVFSPRYLNLIKTEDITNKKLYFSGKVKQELEQITGVLKHRGYNSFLKRMKDLNMGTGVTVLMHGLPGTGKTESAKQLARITKRNLLMVDISSIRDKYVGESEKRLKQVFVEYKRACEFYKKSPILMFNESDALIGKRIGVKDSVDQMNNSMQNILLQELEDFEGILIATTNLMTGLDKAFERRFLMKVKFNKPNVESRYKILKTKLKSISSKLLKQIAEEFSLTGGQIDNIARRIELCRLLEGDASNEAIMAIVESERVTKTMRNSRIGY